MNSAPSFEENFHLLEDAVRRLEAGGLPLEDSIVLYEQASELAARCKALLDGAELRIKQLHERLADPAPSIDEDYAGDGVFASSDDMPSPAGPSLFDRLGGTSD